MKIQLEDTYNFTGKDLQALLNDFKTDVIDRINEDHALSLNPAEYVVVLRTRGCLGRLFDRVFGLVEDARALPTLLRVVLPKSGPDRSAETDQTGQADTAD
jgi:hypothetical protein